MVHRSIALRCEYEQVPNSKPVLPRDTGLTVLNARPKPSLALQAKPAR